MGKITVQELFEIPGKTISDFPNTRYQGSKYKILDWIWENIKNLKFDSVLDAFGGTGSVSYLMKTKGKTVYFNDLLKFNYNIALALIENGEVKVTDGDIDLVLSKQEKNKYPTFIQDNFKEIFYTNEENKWLDRIVTNIPLLENRYKQSMALFALYQACIIKRPFNLFHRSNLYIRTADVKRNFGNKTTWDKPFEYYFKKFCYQANQAILDNGKVNKAFCNDIFDLDLCPDLVYIDTPYINSKGTGVDYKDFYHFLEGLSAYDTWGDSIDYKKKHKGFKKGDSVWLDKTGIYDGFDRLFRKFRKSILVISYRSDGIPSIKELQTILSKYKNKVYKANHLQYKYVLSKHESNESLLIAE